ncbi:extracellular solute-binding protein [Piscinibacter sp. XHJ-5]|uniref:extracellular solute-binding protein n=1 Tax=Piscinibacter sp. XHJ-5 TaxID=3037797 RepID=UPI002452FD6A|nr:extracellular solute-binding protein [Piscinibacter sp. XHJ-5]
MNKLLRRFHMTAAITLAALAPGAGAQTTLNVITGGSQNMVDYVTDYLGPLFEKQNPGVKVSVVGVGPDDAGSQKIIEKLAAQKAAGAAVWDVDVVVPNQQKTGEMVRDGLLAKYRDSIPTGKFAISQSSKKALGVDVDGYVMPMFESQTAIAYNPDLVKQVPSSYDELRAWVSKNPKAFGYNGIKGGMSGVAFVVGWVYAYGGNAETVQQGPYNAQAAAGWKKAFAELKDFNRNVVFTPGNAGTLDMLNRGEIAMGPVWVDMFQSWKADGRLPPNMKLKILAPGMPGQPYYYAIPAKARNAEMAKKFIALATSPQVQAEGIVKRFNWYPGIDASVVKPALDEKIWNQLFTDVTPSDLASYGKPFPLAPFFKDLREQYETQVQN